MQTTVVAWVFEDPILLVGAETDENTGWIGVEDVMIEPTSVPIE